MQIVSFEQTFECNFKYCETFAELVFIMRFFFLNTCILQINDPFFPVPVNKHIRRPYLLLTSLGPDID